MDDMAIQVPEMVTVADIQFKTGGKNYSFDPGELTLEPGENGLLGGSLNTLDGNPPVSFIRGRWNRNYFQIDLAVGPGTLQLTGQVDGDVLHGVVVIEDTPDSLTGTKIK